VSLFLSKRKKKLTNKNKLFQAFDVLFDRPPIRCNIKSTMQSMAVILKGYGIVAQGLKLQAGEI
jgi:hypothetical protein